MSSKLPWTRLFADKWAIVVDYLPAVEGNIYMRLRLRMLHTGEPLFYNIKVLSHYTGYSVKKFEAALNVLLEEGYLIRLADGRLWNLDVEEELKNCNENLNKLSEKAIKAANTKRNKQKDNSSREHDDVMMTSSRGHDDIMMKHININNNNIYKKTKTIVLAKKEIGSENLETTDLVDEPTEVAAVETTSEQIETGVENQPPIHEQENVPKKAKRVKTDRGCRLPADFEPNLQYAIDKGLTHDEALLEFERFTNYWIANSSKNANKRDWQRTWYNWVTSPIGMLVKKKARLEQEKQYANERYKLSTNNFTNSLSQSFSTLKSAITTSDSYGSECSRDTEAISSFASTCQESGPECASSNLYAWKAVDAGGGSAGFARL
ncbi:DUF1376 domain-containing protein [Bartonella taylorii]|uniref:DUF1376 domain-containing protein n=1 Tax=Bartonella taylorii TaxID=33046 RepID=UPI001ABA3B19|nr:DUF1376 domain-containing protein [Bartonella taylorii]